ncbi:MAG TPA: cyclic peptide export ABC transporter, partial [Clostridia bacterium]
LTAIVSLITLFYIFVLVKEVIRKERAFEGNGIKGIVTFITSLGLMGFIGYCLYNIPLILYYGASWNRLEKVGPGNTVGTVICLAFVMLILYIYFVLSTYFTKPNDKQLFMIIALSITSGIGNSIIVFMINRALESVAGGEDRGAAIENRLYIFFFLGILLFTATAMIVRKRLITLTNRVIYEKRMNIIDKILKARYKNFSLLEDGSIHAALNNDTETIGGFVNSLVSGLTGIITLITCFVYLGTLDMRGTIFTISIIFLTVALYHVTIRRAEKFYERNRNFQNTFFKNISDLVAGFKELYINTKKRMGFWQDIENSCKAYRDSRIDGDFRFVNVSILGEILYTGVIGVVVFTFPILFDIRMGTLQNFVLVLLYMGGIVNQAIFSLVPSFMRVFVSWKRVNSFIEKISADEDANGVKVENQEKRVNVQFKGVKFSYDNEKGDCFTVGPIDYDFMFGESIFIMGGNGSGKSTLAKLLTGLYQPDEGEITINGRKVGSRELGEHFSAVYSDYHLFEKLYGIEHENKQEDIEKYLKILNIDSKVNIKDGEFSTLRLSSGQRKRMALLISYLEDRPAYLFDEWASDQDPEFRKFFYKALIPELKARGKTVIAITHDDRYFDEADKLIKMDMGKIVKTMYTNESLNLETSIV